MTHKFTTETGVILVTPTMEALGDQPFRCQVLPASPLLPVETFTVVETYPVVAAQEALDLFKENHDLSHSEAWSLI